MPKMQEQFLIIAKDGMYAKNAGAIFDYCQGWHVCQKCRSNFWSE